MSTLIIREAEAMKLVEELHRPQKYGDYPYFFHLYQVVSIAKEFGFVHSEDIIIACWLHDLLEDTHASYNRLVRATSVEVADIVYNVTDEMGKNRHEKHVKTYPKIAGDWKSLVVKLCDRLANVRFGLETGNTKKTLMYVSEYKEFKEALWFENPRIQPLWDELDKLLAAEAVQNIVE